MSSVRFRLAFILLLLFFSFSSVLYSNTLEICHRAYYVFFPVAYHCNRYEVNEKELKIIGYSKTTGLGNIFGRIEIKGEARGNLHLQSEVFRLHLHVRGKEKVHYYEFRKNSVFYQIEAGKLIEGVKEIENPIDPFMAGLIVYITSSVSEKELRFFYDGRVQKVRYKVLGEEILEWKGKKWNTYKILVVPEVKTTGLLAPRGKWYIWIDKEYLFPVRLRISFVIGFVNAWIESTSGNINLLRKLRQNSSRNP
ncbi:MAG: hypothetical protein DSY42_06370 [Aquifex sp.]|nr:MAG: hypothetical protein DSY42_06370 [Aquifex sp.]